MDQLVQLLGADTLYSGALNFDPSDTQVYVH